VEVLGTGLLGAIAIMIVASIWLASERYSNRNFEDDDPSYTPQRPSQENIDGRISPDFATLLNAVHYEGRAGRKEEKREENDKALRDIITISILGLTFVALGATCIAIFEQVDAMRANEVADHRAWIGATVAIMDQLASDKPVHAKIYYSNTGRQPAPLERNSTALWFTYDDWEVSGKAKSDILTYRDKCISDDSDIFRQYHYFPEC
jgi:hypothetical protein